MEVSCASERSEVVEEVSIVEVVYEETKESKIVKFKVRRASAAPRARS